MLRAGGLACLRVTAQSCLTSSETTDGREQITFLISMRNPMWEIVRGAPAKLSPRFKKLKDKGSKKALDKLTTNLLSQLQTTCGDGETKGEDGPTINELAD
ncbi:hypothetical protein SUGI_1175820 [Cryptomeria japonica]|nr:hypothetical protein SUGI_1175820 [Cryptomeria japonica]